MTDRAESGKRPQIQATLDPALYQRIKDEAAINFDSVSSIVEARLRASYSGVVHPPKTVLGSMKERSTSLDLELKETRLAQMRKELLTVDAAVQVVEDVLGGMRTEGLQLMDDIATDFGLDAKELRRRFLKTMAGPFGVEREPFQRLADDFAKQSLPT